MPNTTRRRIFGVANGADYQLVLVDLPGFQRPMDALTERMQQTVDSSFEDVDVVLLVVSTRATRIGAGDRFVARRVFALGKPVIIALNKIDRLKHGHIASQMKTAADARRLPRAPSGERDDEGRRRRAARRPRAPAARRARAYFPREQATDLTIEERVAEVIREKALHLTRDEVPHAITVEVEEIGDEGRARASCSSRRSRRRGSSSARRARWCARSAPARGPRSRRSSGIPSSSSSSVKVRPKWRRDPQMLERLGM